MGSHTVRIDWSRNDQPFLDNRYSRGHQWRFDGGLDIAASASPQVVPLPMSVAAAVDPEEAFVASLASCHLLWFLAIAQKRGFIVDSYLDEASGELGRNSEGKMAMTRVTLRPCVEFHGVEQPDAATVAELHEQAHAECYIANSVRTEVRCEPRHLAELKAVPSASSSP